MATPIGNLRDISLRALDVLKEVDAVAAEDTRVTARLLDRYGISKRLIPVHEHNERRAAGEVLALLAAGKSLALTSDAGTPAVSDPGALVVAAAREAGYDVVPLPGANAAVTALSAAGLAPTPFLFYGFLPQRAAERRRALSALVTLPCALVFYEAPHRILAALADLRTALGAERRIVIARELTKIHESIHACPLGEAHEWVAADPDRQRGEFVLVVEAAPPQPRAAAMDARRALGVLLDALPVSQAVALAARLTGGKRNEIYRLALELKKPDRR